MYRHRATSEVAITRSVVGSRTVYGSSRKPQNSEPVDLSTTRSLKPETTQVSLVRALAVDRDDRRADLLALADPGVVVFDPVDVTRSQAYSSTSIRQPVDRFDVVDEVPRRDRGA